MSETILLRNGLVIDGTGKTAYRADVLIDGERIARIGTADPGDAAAQFNYALLLENGEGMPIDKSLAAHYYKLAADQGYAAAQCNYSFLLFNGDGIPMDKALAAHYFKMAADLGCVNAQCSYGFILSNGDGIPTDKAL
ncbi:MAG: sel1 repeat family protein, partial [Candidatus Accumulibacter sp.]|nr:sel1 repeat family protein [Accumulibacter sp.]